MARVVADFETTVEPDCLETRVWLWGIGDIDNELFLSHGTDIKSFLTAVSSHKICYFHNLAFDGSYILDWLLRNNFVHTTNRKLPRLTFSTLISAQGKWYSLKVAWGNGNTTEFRDSLKKLPMSVKRVGETFGTAESKGIIDYELYRPVGHIPTDDELDYLKADIMIVVRALRIQFIAGMTRMTVGSDALAEYKRTYPVFKTDFPILAVNIDSDIRLAYRGGFTYLNPKFKAKSVGAGKVYDVNSLYPSVMYDRLLPFGLPEWRDGEFMFDDVYPLFIGSVTFTAKLRRDHIPCIQLRNSAFHIPTAYQTDIDEPITMFVSNVDLELWQSQYDMNILEYHGAWYFKGKTGMFTNYIDKWSEIKRNSTGGMREIAKLHLNSLYGKFATNPNITGKIPTLDDDGDIRLVLGEEEFRKPVYTAMGVFITAYARAVTIKAAQAHYKIFAYADTDSLHLVTNSAPDDLDIDPSRLGAWKHETDFIDARFLRPKAYVEQVPYCTCGSTAEHSRACGYLSHVAGLPVEIAQRITFSDITNGRVFEGKLLPKRVRGGIILTKVGYTLKY